jgi:hypothetical protein
MGYYSYYNVVKGLEWVILLYLVFTVGLLGILSFQLYKSLQAQDFSLARGTAPDIRAQALLIMKRTILWVFGYKGEQRERTAFAKVDLEWVRRYKFSIILRLAPIYGFYTLALVVLTRPIFRDGNTYRIFHYSKNLHELFSLLIAYVSFNLFFDYLSLKFTFSCVLDALATKKYTASLLKSTAFAIILFLLSQAISCIFWIYKRQDPSFPKFDDNILRNFLEISLWPYAFVTGPGSTQITSDPFPGQLLITGTVFVPTTIFILLFVLFSAFLKLTGQVKQALLSHKLDPLCRRLIRVSLIDIFQPPEKVESFGYCNLAFLALLNLFITSIFSAVIARIL